MENTSFCLVIQLFVLIDRFRGQVYAQFFKCLDIHIGKHHRSMHLAAAQLGKLIQGLL